jgi:hypothetical protein
MAFKHAHVNRNPASRKTAINFDRVQHDEYGVPYVLCRGRKSCTDVKLSHASLQKCAGYSVQQVATQLGIAVTTFKTCLRLLGIHSWNRGHWTQAHKECSATASRHSQLQTEIADLQSRCAALEQENTALQALLEQRSEAACDAAASSSSKTSATGFAVATNEYQEATTSPKHADTADNPDAAFWDHMHKIADGCGDAWMTWNSSAQTPAAEQLPAFQLSPTASTSLDVLLKN